MEREFLSVDQLSQYLNLKRSTLYSMVESGELPHYRLGRLIRFKQSDIDAWMESHRREGNNVDKKARGILAINRPVTDINSIVKKSIAEAKGNRYTPHQEKPGGIKGLKEEVKYGIV